MIDSKRKKRVLVSVPAQGRPDGEGSPVYNKTVYDVWDRWLRGLGHNGARTTEQMGRKILERIDWLVEENFRGDSVSRALDQIEALVWCGHEGMTWHMSRIIACRIVENQLEKGWAFGKITKVHCDDCKKLFPAWYLGPSRSQTLEVPEEKPVVPRE